jgi:septum formation protein
VPFEAVDAPLDEEAAKAELQGLGAAALAEALAERKALSVAAGPEALVLGSDQTLEREDGSILGKASSPGELSEQLRSLRGRTHRLHSAAAVAELDRRLWRGAETVALRMRDFSDDFLSAYVEREYETVRWSVGGYHVEGVGAQLFEVIEGSHFALLGLPLLPLLGFLRSRGVLAS